MPNINYDRNRLKNQKSWDIKPIAIKFGPPQVKKKNKFLIDKFSQERKLHRINPSEIMSLHELQRQK